MSESRRVDISERGVAVVMLKERALIEGWWIEDGRAKLADREIAVELVVLIPRRIE